MQQILQEKSKL